MKDAIRAIRLDDARDLARKALELESVAEIEALLNARRSAALDVSSASMAER